MDNSNNYSNYSSQKQNGCFFSIFSLLAAFIFLLIMFDDTTAFLITLFLLPVVIIIQMWKNKQHWNKAIKILLTVLVVPFCLIFVAAGISSQIQLESNSSINDSFVVKRNISSEKGDNVTSMITSTVALTDVPTSSPSPTYTPISTSTPSLSPTDTPSPTPTNTCTPEPTSSPTPTLKKGMEGDEIKQMQIRLIELGYTESTVDGIYADGTEEAVRAFQVRNQLPADGIADRITLNLIFSEEALAQCWVWIPTHGGTKYHNRSGCSEMVNPVMVTLEKALKMNYDACGRCY